MAARAGRHGGLLGLRMGEQRAGMAGRQRAAAGQFLYPLGQVEQAQGVADMGA
jgi:hypothetical protein